MCQFKHIHKFFMESLPLYTSCLILSLTDDIVDTGKSEAICSPTFVVDDFSGLSFEMIFQDYNLMSSETIATLQKKDFHILFYVNQDFFF